MQEKGEELRPRLVEIRRYNKTTFTTKILKLGRLQLKVGDHYWLGDQYVKLIKVTPKGFNFLDESTNHCVVYPHIYPIGFKGKVVPDAQATFWFWVPSNLRLCSVKQAVC